MGTATTAAGEEATRRREVPDEDALGLVTRMLAADAEARPTAEAFDAALAAIREGLRIDRVAILTRDGGAIACPASRGVGPDLLAALAEGGRTLVTGERAPRFVDDLADATEGERGVAAAAAIGAFAIVPFRHGALAGALVALDRGPRGFDLRARQVLGVVASHVAAIAGRLRADELERAYADAMARTVHFSELFVGMVGHDLRNPLSAIATSAELLRLSGGDGARIGERILRGTDRMSRMIDQILDVTRIRLGQGLPLAAVPCDLAVVLGAQLEELRAARPEVGIDVEIAGDTHGVWDPDRLAQLIGNLLGNAVEHGDPTGRIGVALDGTAPREVRLTVANRGAIAPELIPHLFEPFRQGRRKGAKARGLGLGLYTSREVATAHGGELGIASDAERGTRFVATLPR